MELERPEVNEVYAKLIKAKKDFGKALKNAKNPHFKNNYADLNSVLEAVTDALNNHDVFVSQIVAEHNGIFVLKTFAFDSNGDTVDFGIMPIKALKEDAQSFGSGLTYARRYALMSIFGLAPEDDDGNLASIESPLDALRQQAGRLALQCSQSGYDANVIKKALGDLKSSQLSESQAYLAIESLTKMIEMSKKGQV